MPHRFLPAALLVTACAPLFAQTSLRAPLQAWLTHQASPSQYEDWFVPFRKALMLAKSTKCALVPNGGTHPPLYDVLPAIEPLDNGMESFAAEQAGAWPERSGDKLLDLAAAFRAKGDSLEPLLPWLLLLQKRGGADVRVELCLFEAWGTDALDCKASKAAAERLSKLDEEKLRPFLFEAKAFPAGKPGTVQRLVTRLCAGKIDKGAPLGAFALSRAFVAEFEKEYELAMQFGDFAKAASCLETMLQANPNDLSAQLMLEACGGKVKGARFVDRYKDASQADRDAIEARLKDLGLAIVAPDLTVAAAAQQVRDGVALDFFRNDLGDRVKKLDATIKTSEKEHAAKLDKIKDLREDIVELERKIKKFEHIVGMRRECRGWRERIDEKNAEIKKLDAEAQKELQAKSTMEAERSELQRQLDALKKRRSEFRLQRAPGEPEPEEPRAPTPLQPLEPPRQPAPAAPPMVDLEQEMPQAQEVRKATADIERGQLDAARKALQAARDSLAKAPANATTQRMVAVTRYRLAECLQRLAVQRARETRNEAEAEVTLRDADREFAQVKGDDCGTAREGNSLNAAALRSRLVINTTLYCLYRDLAKAKPRDEAVAKKRDDFAKTANRLLAELKDSFGWATFPDGRRVYEVAKAEAEAALGLDRR